VDRAIFTLYFHPLDSEVSLRFKDVKGISLDIQTLTNVNLKSQLHLDLTESQNRGLQNVRRMQSGFMSSTAHHRAGEIHDTAGTNPALGASYRQQSKADACSSSIKGNLLATPEPVMVFLVCRMVFWI
jgi:hypothetical protein